MSKIELIFDDGFRWYRSASHIVKGFFFVGPNVNAGFWEDSHALEYIKENIPEPINLKEWVLKLDGIFTIIQSENGQTTIISDRNNYFPVFFSYKNNNWIISDSWEYIVEQRNRFEPNTEAFPEFLSGGYVLNNETLDSSIFKTVAGEIVSLSDNGDIKRTSYFEFTTQSFFQQSFGELSVSLHKLFMETAQRMISLLNGRTAVVPLSGGYDSRLIACMLKKMGYENTICITYGKWNPEAAISKKVAEQLKFRWIFVDYEQIDYKDYLHSESFKSYISMAGNGFSMPFLQEYFAVLELKEKQQIPPDSVFLPGHHGDYIGGNYVSLVTHTSKKGTELTPLIAKTYFTFVNNSTLNQKHIEKRIATRLNQFRLGDDPHPQYSTTIEAWDIKEKRAKFIFHSSSVFNWAGYKVAFPLWNNPFVDFFRNTPFEYRSQKRLYDQTLEEYFFIPMNVHYAKDELNPTATDRLLFPVKKRIKKILPMAFTAAFLKKNDWSCYDKFTELMQKDLKEKGKQLLNRYNSYNAIICQWYLDEVKNRFGNSEKG